MNRTERTQLVYSMIDKMAPNGLSALEESPDFAALMESAMNAADSDAFIQNIRPEPAYYFKILSCSRKEREKYTLRDRGKFKASIMQIAEKDALELLGADFEGSFSPARAQKGAQSLEDTRRKELDLCLSIPKLRYEQVDWVLTRFLASNPLHLRYAIDAVYAFVFRSRDCGCAGFETIEAQYAYIEHAVSLLSGDDPAAMDFLSRTVGMIPDFMEVAPGDKRRFEQWLSQMKRNFDARNHRYGVRAHLQETLRFLDRAASRTSCRLALFGLSELERRQQYEDVLDAVDHLEAIERSDDLHFDGGSASNVLNEQEFSGMAMVAGDIAVCFQDLWHALGADFLRDRAGALPADFDAPSFRQEYAADPDFRERNEPRYMADLREYLKKHRDDPFGSRADRLEEARRRFDQLMEGPAFLYIFSDWQYACVAGNKKYSGLLARAAREKDTDRLLRITRTLDSVAATGRTDVQDVPRGLLVLSELTRIQVSGRRYTQKRLSLHINDLLTEYGYAPLDVRRRMDFLFYCAMRIAEDAADDSFEMGEMLEALLNCIKAYTFDRESLALLSEYEGLTVPNRAPLHPERR